MQRSEGKGEAGGIVETSHGGGTLGATQRAGQMLRRRGSDEVQQELGEGPLA